MIYRNDPDNCPHLHISKEVYCGTKTGDYICDDCGETFMYKPTKPSESK